MLYNIIVAENDYLKKVQAKILVCLYFFDNLLFRYYYIHILVIVLKFGENVMKKCIESENEKLHHRMKRIIGQVQAIDRMIEEDVACEDVLSQINAAKSALHKAGQAILENHIKYCISEGMKNDDVEEIMKRFSKAMERFANMK